ncbi:DUF4132 domain-containing protein [Leptospira kmetyi]|uniref:DUF4132 domain-containing protein n=1 Tax=Leptospira kmetyi TaxID=408139 RepID=UPI001AEFFDD2|nr:DUF4132 domain-containing protein [Leptospira kmetyi]
MIRNFIYQKGRSEKFFTIEIASDSKSFTILQGQRYGDAKKPEKETFASKELCEKKTETLVKAKLKEGYEEIPLGIKNVNPFDLKILADAKKQKSEKLKIDVNQSVDLMNEILGLEFLEDLEIHNVSEIPDRLGSLKNLNDLEIRESKNLKTIPSSLGELTSLTRLTIERTGISTLPDSLANLKNLTNLYVQHNEKLEGLPDCIGSLQSLKLLWASYNREGEDKKGKRPLEISNAIGNLENLDELNLCSNGLSELPPGLAKLKNLTELELNFNVFKNIPECIFEMENLEVLQMIYCPIRSIPKEFTKLENLSRIELEGHEIKNVPEEILEEGVEAIREFLNDSPEKKETRSIVSEGEDLKRSLESHKDALDKFYRAVKGKMYQENTRKKFAELQKYLQGESDEVPKTVKDDLYYFQPITDVLSSFRNWSAVDHRILAYITQGSWAFDKNKKGFFESFYRWLGREVLAHPEDSSLFTDVLSALKKMGQDEAAILSERTHNVDDFVLTEDKKITSIGRYLLDHGEELMPQLLKDGLPSSFVELFVREDFKKIEPHLEEITKIKEYDGTDGKKHIPLETFGILTRVKPELLEPIILDRLENIDCVSCKAELMYDLYEAMPKKYSEKTFEFAKSTLAYISEKKNSNIDRGYRFSWSLTNGRRYEDNTPEFIEWLLKNFGSSLKEEVFAYVEKTKVLDLKVTAVAVKYLGQAAIDIAGEALDMTIKNEDIAGHFRQTFRILSDLDYGKYYDKTWEIAKSEFKKVSETACMALSRLPEEVVVPKAIELLKEKQSYVREAGALTLSLLNTPKSIQGLKVLIETEKNDAVRNFASDLIYDRPNSISIAEAKARIDAAKKLGKLEKPIAKWLDETKLPKILWKDKKPLGPEEVRYLFYRQKTVSEIVVDKELRDVIALVDKNSCKEFSEKLFALIGKNGGFKAPNRFAIGVLGILGNDSVVSPIETVAIKETNLNACACLGLIRSLEAALALDRIVQKFKTKYPNVRDAAQEAFESIAFEMGLTPYELQDRMLPDFGFAGLSKKLNISKTEYTVKISPSLSFVYLNGDGKPVKTPPKQNETEKKKQKEENSLLKETARQFSNNLENSMVVQRKWSIADWKEFYLKNPVANAFAQNFVWTFDSKGKAETNRFHLDGDQILTIEDKPAKIDENAKIYLVHPYLLSEAEKKDWAEKFKTKDVKPTFPQLNRPIHLVPDGDKDKKMSRQFEDGEISGSTFKYRAKKYGWRRGSVVDAGEVSSYKKVFPGEEIEVFVKLQGMNVSAYDYDEQVTIGEFFFANAGSIKTGSYVYDEPRGEEDFRLHSLQKVNPILYSETVYDLKRILESKGKDDAAEEE